MLIISYGNNCKLDALNKHNWFCAVSHTVNFVRRNRQVWKRNKSYYKKLILTPR